jgi:rsbT co-antagonist protein RsbR
LVKETVSSIPELVKKNEKELLSCWVERLLSARLYRSELLSPDDLRRDAAEFLESLGVALEGGDLRETEGPQWERARDVLASLSRTRARQGFSPTETDLFVFSIKEPLFDLIRRGVPDPGAAAEDIIRASSIIDKLGLYTTEVYQKGRDEVIRRQQTELLELSTPVVRLWDGVLALPLIGVLDSARTQIAMENLLKEIMVTGSSIAIVDITGVPMVDTLVAQHLLKTVAAARLMGADCIISGIRPQIAQTIVHLGVTMGEVVTKATLSDAFRLALQKTGQTVTRIRPES